MCIYGATRTLELNTMKTKDFYFDLPETLIAQYPLENRSDSKLLVYNRKTKECQHKTFKDLVEFLEPGDLLVMNDSKVIPARLFGHKSTGGKVELLVERLINQHEFLAHIKASKAPKPGDTIHLSDKFKVDIVLRDDDLFHCAANGNIDEMLEELGHVPLPPYIKRTDESMDRFRYQTVYAAHKGSVAAPTAGLHFDNSVLNALANKEIQVAYTTLHVASGTFRPVRSDTILEHKMHYESYQISAALCEAVSATKAAGKKVIAVGTTAMRSLESAVQHGDLQPGIGETNIFIYPGYQFKLCDGLITNFHLPESTLLMLVSAFIGHQEAMSLYEIAVKYKYRFFSYGDASLLI